MIGCTHLERGQPVTILTRWGPGGGPRNVLIQRQDGSKTVRPFRGLRRPPDYVSKLGPEVEPSERLVSLSVPSGPTPTQVKSRRLTSRNQCSSTTTAPPGIDARTHFADRSDPPCSRTERSSR
jgi:hypothetical protein